MSAEAIRLAALCGRHGMPDGADALSWIEQRLEFADRHDERTRELIEANNRHLDEARDARAKHRHAQLALDMYAAAWVRELGGRLIRKSHKIDALVLTTRHIYQRAQHADRLDALAAEKRRGIYVASKVVHAPMWKMLRAAGLPIISTWIDEAGEGESQSLEDLWRRCVFEAAAAKVLIVYRVFPETLKGAYVELGAALSAGVPVYAVGIDDQTVANHAGITRFEDLNSALEAARQLIASPA